MRYECFLGSTFPSTLEENINLGKRLVQNIIDKLGDRFVHQLSIFNACKIFSPRDYDNDRDVLTNQIDGWCLRLLDQFSIGEAPIVDREKREGEIDRFTILLKRCFSRKNMIDSWKQCAGRTEWVDSFLIMVRLWQVMLVIPASTAACERGFSRQNLIKTSHRTSLSLETLDCLMFLSLHAPTLEQDHAPFDGDDEGKSIDLVDYAKIDWDAVYETWKAAKERRMKDLRMT